jgi:peptidoglycan/LPS O-acetylase OafA/YrhL
MARVTASQTSRTPVLDPLRTRRLARAAVLDVLLVLAFVAVGRRQHGESEALAGTAGTAWPFLAGLAVGWLVVLAARLEPQSAAAGLALTVPTVVLGLLLRRFAAGEGTAAAFVVVATAFLTLVLLGRRVAVGAVARRLARAG